MANVSDKNTVRSAGVQLSGISNTIITNAFDLIQMDSQRDLDYCGCSLSAPFESAYAYLGAHAPTYTCYFVLDVLFSHFSFTPQSRLLDVGCGTGRVLAYYAQMKYPGQAVGIEIDPVLAERCRSWANSHANLDVLTGNVLETNLEAYTDFYLFNPFDDYVLEKFIQKLEMQATKPVTLGYMSDDPTKTCFDADKGWSVVTSGWIQDYQGVRIYGSPQHYSILQFLRHR